jgi:putative transposase
MTINIIQAGQRYTLHALPFTQLDDQRKLVKDLIEFARQRVKIKLLLFDKGFDNTECQKLVNSFGIKYIIPCVKNDDVKKILAVNPTPFVLNDCVMRRELLYNMAAITRKNRKGADQIYAYATNIPLDEKNMEKEAHWIDQEYRRRWGIETSYRTKKQSYLPKTTSKNYRIRLFYFFFSVLLYNMWILSNVLVFIEVYGKVGLKPIVTANFFRTVFFYIDPGG